MGPKAVFIITLSTLRMIFPGIAPTVTLPGQEPPKSIPVTCSVTMNLFADRKAPQNAYARVQVPESLKAGKMVKLFIEPGTPAAQSDNAATSTLTQRTYWGSGEEIKPGQPRSTAPQISDAPKLPNQVIAYWPADDNAPKFEEANPQGLYTLDTNFVGATTVTLGPDQTLLGPINVTSETDKLDLTKALEITWKAVPKAVGYLVSAVGGDKDLSINWTSSSDPDAAAGLPDRAIAPDEMKTLLEKGIVLSDKTTSCTIPAGVFSGARGAMISITAFGRDLTQDKNGIQTRVMVRSTANIAVMASKPSAKP